MSTVKYIYIWLSLRKDLEEMQEGLIGPLKNWQIKRVAMSKIKLPKNPGDTGWKDILPNREVNQNLTENLNADYVIIGGGFAGLSAARRLNQIDKNAKVVLLEACEIGEGPAGRNSGFMIDLPHNLASDDYLGNLEKDLEQTLVNRSAIEFAKSASDEYQMPSEAIQHVGKTNAAATKKGMAFNTEYGKHLTKTGENFKMLDANEMKDLTGIDYYINGLWTPGTAMLQPALYIQKLADGVSKNTNITIINTFFKSFFHSFNISIDTIYQIFIPFLHGLEQFKIIF